MKFVNFFHEGAVRTGLLGPDGVVDLAAAGLWQGSAPVKMDDIEALRSKVNLANLPARSLEWGSITVAMRSGRGFQFQRRLWSSANLPTAL
jgi:hypothetical protein